MAFDKKEFKKAVDDSQIAYLECLEDGYNALANGVKGEEKPTLEEIIKVSMGTWDYYRAYRKVSEIYSKMGRDISEITISDLAKYSTTLSDADKKRIAELSQEAFSYKIQGVYNVKEYNGFYACLIDKGNGEKSIGIRGSEDIRNKENFRHDWKDNDFGLVQRRETSQQKEVRYMLEYFKDTRQLDDLKKLTVAGHSLGGNLASHAAVVMAEDGFEDLYEKLDKVYNLDGPGVSKKYLDSHKEQIEKLGERDIVQHAKWSVVGNLLFEIPNSYERELDINENKLDRFMGKKENGLLGKIKRLFCKHSTVCVTPEKKQEDKWELKDGKEDGLSKFLGTLSRSVDIFVPEIITFAVGKIAFWMAEKVIVEPENETEQPLKEEVIPEAPRKVVADEEKGLAI